MVEKPKAGQREKAFQGSATEEILGDEGKHLSRFNSGVLQGDEIPLMFSFKRYMVDRLDISMIFVLQISRTLTTNSRAWTLAFRPWMNKLKLFRTRSLSCNMARMTEEKQSVECSKQSIVFTP